MSDAGGVRGRPFRHHGRGGRGRRRGRGGRRPARLHDRRLRARRRSAAHLSRRDGRRGARHEGGAIRRSSRWARSTATGRRASTCRTPRRRLVAAGAGLRDRIVVQRTSAGTQGVVAAAAATRLWCASLVVGSATAAAVRASGLGPPVYVLTGRNPAAGPESGSDDRSTAELIERARLGLPLEAERTAREVATSAEAAHTLALGPASAPPDDIELAIRVDAFAVRDGGRPRRGRDPARTARTGAVASRRCRTSAPTTSTSATTSSATVRRWCCSTARRPSGARRSPPRSRPLADRVPPLPARMRAATAGRAGTRPTASRPAGSSTTSRPSSTRSVSIDFHLVGYSMGGDDRARLRGPRARAAADARRRSASRPLASRGRAWPGG